MTVLILLLFTETPPEPRHSHHLALLQLPPEPLPPQPPVESGFPGSAGAAHMVSVAVVVKAQIPDKALLPLPSPVSLTTVSDDTNATVLLDSTE